MALIDFYRERISSGLLQDDPQQYPVLAAFERLGEDLTARRLPWQRREAVKGLYLWGGVGRGKTMLMDLAMTWLTGEKKVRCCRFHFHDFMAAVHDRVKEPDLARERDPARHVAAHIANNAKVIFFDEMEIRDIADAMIVSRVMGGFMETGGVLVMTSNRNPDDLYKGGLHRDRFLPFIEMIKQRLVIHEMASETDWRQRILDGMDGYFEGDNEDTRILLDDVFIHLSGGMDPEPGHVLVAGRDISFDRVAGSVLSTNFVELCMQPLASRDYLAIAERFAGIVLQGIPVMDDTMRNEARRFIWLIDALYDKGRFLVASSPVAMENLYAGETWAAEFPRTVSRLTEMTRINPKSAD
jgi:cell division protein ZapE